MSTVCHAKYFAHDKELAEQLEMHVRHIVEGRTPEDILFEILLKSGFRTV